MPLASGRARKRADPDPLPIRIFHNADSEVWMLSEGYGQSRVRVQRPVTRKRLDDARMQLIAMLLAENREQLSAQPKQPPVPERVQTTDREIRTALDPLRAGTWLDKALHVVETALAVLMVILGTLFLISLAYKGIEFSSRRFPEAVHLTVLAAYAIALGVGIRVIATGKSRARSTRTVRNWLGPAGFLVLSGMILVAAAAFFASVTFVLHRRGLLVLDPCRGLAVTEPHLLDFYMWHFLKMVPFVNIPETLRWEMPLCYSQGWVGLMILLFQASTVLPCLATAAYYFKNRRRLAREHAWKYVYDSDWSPEQPPTTG
jgi:hypothetical protein